MTRPAVAVVTTFYRPVLGGAEAAGERLATFLQRRGHRVTVLTKRVSLMHAEAETIDGVLVERLRPVGERTGRGKWMVLPALFVALLRRRHTIDVICCVDYRGIGLAALAAGRLTGKPVVFQAQTEGVLSGARLREWLKGLGFHPEGFVARVVTSPIRWLYGRADAIGCISRSLEREALAAGVPRDRVRYLPNPVDTTLFTPPSPDERRLLRQELGVDQDAVLCAFVGRLSREKGVLELVRAWAGARPRARLVLVGPPMTDHPWDVSREAREFVETNALTDRVTFVGGQPVAVVARWLRAADFAVQPSHFEAMGLAAAEEMAAGLPVIASDTGGFRDFVVEGETGALVPVGDVTALGVALTTFAGDAALRRRLGQQARRRAEQFDERIVLGEFAQLIDTLAARG